MNEKTIVIFGASGDLTRRKLIPALYRLFCQDKLTPNFCIVGAARRDWSRQQWCGDLLPGVQQFARDLFDADRWASFCKHLDFATVDIVDADAFARLAVRLDEMERGPRDRVYYLATLPRLYAQAAAHLGAAGLRDETTGARRLIVEKPFGVDRATAEQLNRDLHQVFDEHQVYRIDHYLGKETVQNLVVLRFANSIFEPIWNRNYIDHVQITVAESVDVGGRGGYYDSSGVLRDMFQNHLLQLMMITAMEAPVRFEATAVRDENVKVLRAVRALTGGDFARDTVRGQYRGYRAAEGVRADSQTATFAALKLHIDNWRWKGVPFYLRSGKAMSCRTSQIVIQFHEPPHLLFDGGAGGAANRLVVQIQPEEGIQLHMQSKAPHEGMRLTMTPLDLRFQDAFQGALPDAYQRLLLDSLNGDASLFARSDEVELAWGIIDPILAAWDSQAAPPLGEYELGDWGPSFSPEWMASQGRNWFDLCPVIH